jgi:hypothetical protein
LPQTSTVMAIEDECGRKMTEAPPGFEPGLADLQSAGDFAAKSVGADHFGQVSSSRPARALHPSLDSDLDLTRVAAAWPDLPAAIRAGIRLRSMPARRTAHSVLGASTLGQTVGAGG